VSTSLTVTDLLLIMSLQCNLSAASLTAVHTSRVHCTLAVVRVHGP